MAENAQREMTLREWVERLPASHLARREYDALTTPPAPVQAAHPAAGDKVREEVLTIKVDASEVKSMLADLLVKLTPPTGEELIDIAPGEYSDWEKRVWRRGYQAAVTAMREAVASVGSEQG